MSGKILFICNSSQLYNEMTTIKNEYKYIDILKINGLEPVSLIEQLSRLPGRAIVALPITGNAISSNISIPIISLHPTSFDLLEAFSTARLYSSKITYVGYFFPALQEDLPRIENILGIKINIFSYENVSQREREFNKAMNYKEANVAVVTGDFTKGVIEGKGGKAIIVKIGRFAILQALRTAIQVIKSKEDEVKKNKWLQMLLDLTNDGVIGTDSKDNITTFNRKAGQYLGMLPKDILGCNLKHLNDDHPVNILMGKNEPVQESEGRICTLKDKNLLVNKSILTDKNNDNNQVILTFKDESEIKRLQAAIYREAVKRGMIAKYTFKDIIGRSVSTLETIETAKKYAKNDSTILITGETGVGKEVFAQSIHNYSDRREGPFVAINCATIPESLLESELFGYEGGSFTGAKKEGQRGLFELANGGTIFLDEIGEMSITLQARLLRVLQNKEIRHIGGDKVIPVNVRIIAATNRNLEQAINENSFRQDLYYRISILNLFIPPLRQRKEDVPDLVQYFIKEKSFKYNKTAKIDEVMVNVLNQHDWPGNVRQLEGFIEKYVILYEDHNYEKLTCQLIAGLNKPNSSQQDIRNNIADYLLINIGPLENMEKQVISDLLPRYGMIELSKLLGISRTTLWRKLKNYGYKVERMLQ